MSRDVEIAGIRIPESDWAATPASVKALVEGLVGEVEHLDKQFKQISEQVKPLAERLGELEEKLSKNSKNSSKPPPSEGFGKAVKPKQEKGQRQRGGQVGHQGHNRDLYPLERCDEVIEHYPSACKGCGETLRGEDSSPYHHQIVELPPIVPIVSEHRLHQLRCEHCGEATRARLPQALKRGYGQQLSGLVGLLSGSYRLSHQRVVSLLSEVFNVRLSSSVNRLRRELNAALIHSKGSHQYGVSVPHAVNTGDLTSVQLETSSFISLTKPLY